MTPEKQIPGQEQLPGMPEAEQQTLPKRKAVAFGRVPTLEYFKMGEAVYEGITSEDLERVHPESLRNAIYHKKGSHRIDGIAFPIEEYADVPIYIKSLGEKSASNTAKARQIDHDPYRRRDKIASSENKTFVRFLEKIKPRIEGLTNEEKSLDTLLQKANRPGYAQTDELIMRQLAVTAWDRHFRVIVEVAANQNKWSVEQTEMAHRAMIKRLLVGTGNPGVHPHRERTDYWIEMIKLTKEYSRDRKLRYIARAGVLSNKIRNYERLKIKQNEQSQ